jgi:hypothetical protein
MQDLVQSQYSSFNSRNSQYSSLFLNSAAAAAHRLPVKSEAPWGGAEYHHSAEFAPHPLSDRSYAGHPYSNMAAASGECLTPPAILSQIINPFLSFTGQI